MGGMGADDGHPRARRPEIGQSVPHTVVGVHHRRGVAILLTYGPNREWLKNVVSAGGATMRRYGKTLELTNPRVMPKAEAAPAVVLLTSAA
jgi:hypothetical protein